VTTSKFESGVAIGATGTANTLAGIPFFSDTTNGSIYTHDVSGTDDTAANNTAFGLTAMDAITTGDSNVAIGHAAGSAMTTSEKNVIVGKDAGLVKAASSNRGVHIGFESAKGLTTGSDILSIGYQSYLAADTEDHNLAIGRLALGGSINGGEYNVAVGNFTLDALTTADYCTAVGYQAGTSVTTGGYNTLIGYSSGDAITDADTNTAIGYDALTANVHGDRNTAVGYGVLRTHTVASKSDVGNTCMGYLAGADVTTGDGNTLIGHQAYATGTSLTTGSSNVAIGMDLTINTNSHSNSICIGQGIEGYTNRFSFGKASNVVENTFTSDANWSRSSDERLKTNITDVSWKALDFINELRPITFNWKASQDISDTMIEHDPDKNNMDTTTVIDGLVAQEVKAAMDKHDMDNFSGWKERPNRLNKEKTQQISKEAFVMPIIKAIQELSAKVKALEEA
jgi:hypothetical protein